MNLFFLTSLSLPSRDGRAIRAVYIEYKPYGRESLPTHFVIDGERALPEYDFQGHSSSIQWAIKKREEPNTVRIESRETEGLVWDLPESWDCMILVTDTVESEDEEEDETLSPAIECAKVFPRTDMFRLLFGLFFLLWTGVLHTVTGIVTLDSVTWTLLGVSILGTAILCSKRPSTGKVRISYFDERKKAEFISLPSGEFPHYSDRAILSAMEADPDVSSISLFLLNHHH